MEKEKFMKNGVFSLEYDKETLKDMVLKLQEEKQKQKEIINRAKEKLKQGITFCKNDSQGSYDVCNIAINREKEILQILEDKEV